MTILSLDPVSNQTPDALRNFLAQCQKAAHRAHRPQLVSISMEVTALDPLSVLASIFEPLERHFYVERPFEHLAIAGAEAVLEFSATGPGRFDACQAFIDDVLGNSIVVGDQGVPFAGPHFFTAFAFFNDVGTDEPFPSASVFVPRWQVATRHERTVAVANLIIAEDTDVTAAADKVWRAHSKFGGFSYADRIFTPDVANPRINLSGLSSDEHYCDMVQRAVGRIGSGEFDKIVLARAKDLVADQPMHPMQALHGLRQKFPECFAFSMANGRGQSFIGASPERLVRGYGGMLMSEALAGSTRRGKTEIEDEQLGRALLHSAKDRHEHQLVLDSILRRLKPLGLQLEYTPEPALRRLANVQHLHTPIKTALPVGVRLLDVISRLHPTPAVGGVPRESALTGIRSLETFARGLYAGAIGWVDSRGNGEFFVGLRSALIDGPRARLYAGAGIVAGSQPVQELAETELKFKAMEDALFSP
ncbi:MAG: isochorismate synthase [Cephaloticoccus sp.]|nr:isochorismate synthase [Cephaloticoccus sp.]MCF7759951.1 isochorismate synthase [Cephaloticoccus sp.]